MVPQPSASQVISIAPPSTTGPVPITTTTTTTTTATTPIPTPTSTPTPTPTSTATPAPGPAAVAGGTSLKRPATSDLQRIAGTSATPSNKRQATASGNYNVRPIPIPIPIPSASPFESPASSHPELRLQQPSRAMMPAPAPAPALITEDQLHGRTPEQLITTILQLQTQHQQFVAQINAQYESINQQLNDLRGSLIASHQAAATALISTREQPPMRPMTQAPHPALPQQTAIPPPPRPPMQTQMQSHTPTRPTPRMPPVSPGHQVVPRSSVSTSAPTTAAGPPQYDYRTVATVEEVWKEYRQGLDGQPAIEQLDSVWGSRWRPEPRGRTWYSRRKVIWDKIKEFMAEGMEEDAAVQEVEKLRDGGTINRLIRMLQDERKDKGIGEDGTLS